MNQIIFTVRDSKAAAYLPPFFMFNEAMAIRAIQDAVNDEKHQFHLHPEDYHLFRIGVFDDDTGEITPEAPTVVVGAMDLVPADERTESPE